MALSRLPFWFSDELDWLLLEDPATDLDARAAVRLVALRPARAARGERHPRAATGGPPGDVLLEEALCLAGDPDPLAAGALAEPGDPALAGRGLRLVGGAGAQADVGERPHNHYLVALHGDLRGTREPTVREPSGEPTADRRCVCV